MLVCDIEIGMTVPIDGTKAVVVRLSWMDGKNGEPPMMITNKKTRRAAIAKKIEFLGHPAVYAHPESVVG